MSAPRLSAAMLASPCVLLLLYLLELVACMQYESLEQGGRQHSALGVACRSSAEIVIHSAQAG